MQAKRHTFPRTHRLSGKLAFTAVFDGGLREARNPLLVFARPNDRAHPRLGLSVPRRVGTAPKRNAIKRRLREAFRFLQHDLPRGYDLIIVVRPHDVLLLADYQRLLSGLLTKLHRKWEQKLAADQDAPRTT
jgi:ribonuclease P protein component